IERGIEISTGVPGDTRRTLQIPELCAHLKGVLILLESACPPV
ncbi:MAG: hypothetical protein K0Q50_2957, partial [Vampirovibrio sp.]|nr:hypothetical protein [Vampirovibrio sp.]